MDDSCRTYVAHLACALLTIAVNDPVLMHVKQVSSPLCPWSQQKGKLYKSMINRKL
jgi:hypothetical protein